jgi:hypothetical protein
MRSRQQMTFFLGQAFSDPLDPVGYGNDRSVTLCSPHVYSHAARSSDRGDKSVNEQLQRVAHHFVNDRLQRVVCPGPL